MNKTQYTVLIIALGLGVMGLLWDTVFFLTIIIGLGSATISEPNTTLLWGEFLTMVVFTVFVLAVLIKQIVGTKKGIWKGSVK